MASMEEHAKRLDFWGVMVALIISSFGFVSALFWRDAINSLIQNIVPEGEGLTYHLAAALIVTAIAVTAIFVLSRFTREDEEGN